MSEPRRSGAQRIERVLVVDSNIGSAKMLANLLRGMWPATQIYGAQDAKSAFTLAVQVNPQLIFVEAVGADLDGIAFVRKFRRSEYACREAPVIMIFGEATASQILDARDSGVHELMRRPFTMGDMQKRLDAVSGRPRDWIEAVQYVGPDRRRFNSVDYKGPRKRRADGSGKTQKMEQALRIVRSAAGAVESDPVQAARALATQARILLDLSAGQVPYRRLAEAALQLQTYLDGPAVQKGLSKDQVQTIAVNLINAAPPELKMKAA